MNEHAKLPPQPTSSMKQFDVLVGEWNMVGTHPALPDAAHGHSSFEWLVEGALLLRRFNWEPEGPPSARSTGTVRASMKNEPIPTSLLLPDSFPILRLQIEETLGHKGILWSFSFTLPSL